MNEWEAFLFTEEERLARRKVRNEYTPDMHRMKVVQGMQRVQERKARVMVYRKNRVIAQRRQWRRLWDGRGGADFERWKEEEEHLKRIGESKAMLRAESDYESSGSEQSPSMRKHKMKPSRVKVQEYDVAGTYSDPRTRRFSFGSETGSEDDRDKAEAKVFLDGVGSDDGSDFDSADDDGDDSGGGGFDDGEDSGAGW